MEKVAKSINMIRKTEARITASRKNKKPVREVRISVPVLVMIPDSEIPIYRRITKEKLRLTITIRE